MALTPIGDLATSLTLRSNSATLKYTIDRLTQELVTGQTTDIHTRLGGNFAYLSEIDTSLTTLSAFAIATSEAGITADAMQVSLDALQSIGGSLSAQLLAAGTNVASPTQSHGSVQARSDLDALMATLNTSVAGRSLFSGTATDSPALSDAETLLTGLRGALAGLTDVADIRAAATDWFANPAGFPSIAYTGGTDDLPPVRISDAYSVDLGLRADDQVFRDLLQETALAALAGDPALALDDGTAAQLRHSAGTALLGVSDALSRTRADLGFQQSRIEDSAALISANRAGLEQARGALLGADPFETAARLEEAQYQLQALFTVAARSAALKLVNFL